MALVISGDNAVAEMHEMIGPQDATEAKAKFPNSIRALFGTDRVHNAVHVSETVEEAHEEINTVFPNSNAFETRPNTSHANVIEQHAKLERTLALIKPDAYGAKKKDAIVQLILAGGFRIVNETEIHLKFDQAQEFYKEHEGKPFYDELVRWMSSKPIYALVLEKESAISAWRELAGPTNSIKAKEIAPNSIRALFGTDGSKNAVHGSDAPSSADREIRIIFGTKVSTDPLPLKIEATLALIKPDAYPVHKDAILKRIQDDGFAIYKEAEVRLTPEQAQEFYKEHVGKPFYETLCGWMSSAPIYALVLEKPDGVKAWRALAGPTNSEKARAENPDTIRAQFGKDGSENAVHGSDSYESAQREIKVIFGEELLNALNEEIKPIKKSASGTLKKSGSTSSLKKSGSQSKVSNSLLASAATNRSKTNLSDSKRNIASPKGSKTQLAPGSPKGSKTQLTPGSPKGSKSQLAATGSPKGSKSQLAPGSPKGSKSALTSSSAKGSKSQLTKGSKPDLAVSGSKSNLAKSASQTKLSSRPSSAKVAPAP